MSTTVNKNARTVRSICFQGTAIAIFLVVILCNILSLYPLCAESSTSTTSFATSVQSSSASPGILRSEFHFLGNKNIAPVLFLQGDTAAGLAADIVNEMSKHMSKPIVITAMDWTNAQQLVAAGEADALIQINQNPERLKIYDFSDPLLESHFSIFVRDIRGDISDLVSLKGKRVGVEAGGLPAQVLANDNEIESIVVPNFTQAFALLNADTIDAVIVDYRVGAYILAANNIRGVKVVGMPIASSYSALAVKKGNVALLSEINTALRTIKTDGTYQAILDRWKPKEVIFITQEKITDYIHTLLIIILLISLIATAVWSLLLMRELKKRKIAETAELKAKKYSEKLVSAANAMIICLDREGKINVFNEAAENITGYKKEEVIGQNWFRLVVPRNLYPEAWKIFEDFQKQGKSILGEFQNPILTKSGEERIIEWRNSDLLDGNSVVGTISFGIDVTEQKLIEKKRIESEEKFSAAFNASPDLMAITRAADGKILEINEGYTRMLGYERAESVGKTTAELAIWADTADRAKFISLLQQNNSVIDFETKLKRKDGKIITVIDSARMFDLLGQACILSTAHDISDRIHEEQELKRTNRALSILSATNQELIHVTEEKALLDKISKIITDIGGYRLMWIGFAYKDRTKTLHVAAQSGFMHNNMTSPDINWEDAPGNKNPASVAIRTGKTQIAYNIQNDPKLSPWRDAAVQSGSRSSIALPLTSEGETFGVVNIYSSETDAFNDQEVKILEELTSDLAFGITTLRKEEKIEERTKEIDQLKNKFIQIVSHQLNTPLNVIRWSLEAIMDRKRGEVPAAILELLKGTYAADLEIISRIGDLLTAMNIEEGQIHLSRDATNMDDLLRPTCEEKLKLTHLKNITYEITPLQSTIPIVNVDAEKIRDVVARLVDNAVTYTKDGGHINVKYFTQDHTFRFEITDSGVGIPSSEQSKVFERFHRGWNAAQMKPDASGLSLYIAKKYIDIHDGRIGFNSTEEGGSTFWFELPQ
ncbi:MAG TPA: transporter substrate-binding domain-containing protein [Candidatus Paceibacterota bacterium]|nr:transporter substrate-binding domain-containing protein [Candidatus Paceibacterota bacterium]